MRLLLHSFLLSFFLFAACGDLELPEEDEASSSSKKENASSSKKEEEEGGLFDSVVVNLPEVQDSIKEELNQFGENYGTFTNPYKIATFLTLDDYTLLTNTKGYNYVKGYIVGYGSSGRMYFEIPEKVNTCLVIADSYSETDAQNCIAVFLPKTGDNFRSDFNLYDHPELLGCGIIVKFLRRKNDYYGQKYGIDAPLDFTLAEKE